MSITVDVDRTSVARPSSAITAVPVVPASPQESQRLSVTVPAYAPAPSLPPSAIPAPDWLLEPTTSGLATLDPARPSRDLCPDTDDLRVRAAGMSTVVTLPSGLEISLTVRRGEAVGLTGPPDSGKTLLVQLVTGLLESPTDLDAAPGGVRLVVDDAAVHEDLTVEATVRYWAAVCGAPGGSLADSVEEVIAAVGLGRWRNTPIADCHQVVRCALAIAVALLDRPSILVLDEPLRKVAARHRPAILRLLDTLRAHGIGLLYATRRETEAAALCGRIVTLPDAAEAAISRAG